ncbi:hypothetical protein ACIQHU_39385 [Streptomyces tendae]|uniref:hypothetical protein n=1 Tax=Streptomyces tendae TaxID=1932 RepID=UPI003801BE61
MTGTVEVPSFHGYSGATLHLTIDDTEHTRRQTAGLGPVTNWSILNTCMNLPHNEPLPWRSLSPRDREDVHRAPQGVFAFTGPHRQTVTRLLLRPCRIVQATVRAATASATALGKATQFAPMCERSLIITRRPRTPDTLIEFGYWGVGLYLDHGGELETLVEPAPWRPQRHTPAGWRFTERAYATYLKHATPAPERTRT